MSAGNRSFADMVGIIIISTMAGNLSCGRFPHGDSSGIGEAW
jgi:hypothetical protein